MSRGRSAAEQQIADLLHTARKSLRLSVAFLSRLDGTTQHLEVVESSVPFLFQEGVTQVQETTLCQAILDKKLPAVLPDLKDFPAAMADMLPEELVTEMWVDADNLPRKFAQTIEVPAVGGGQPTTSSTEGTYSDFGTDVEIEAPPADQVTEDMFPGAA